MKVGNNMSTLEKKRISLLKPKLHLKIKVIALRTYFNGLCTTVLTEGLDGGMYHKYLLADAPKWIRKEVLGYE